MPMAGQPRVVARIIWYAMLAAVAIYALLVGIVGGRVAGDPGVSAIIRQVFMGLAAAQTLAVWFIHRRFLAPALERSPGATGGADPQRAFSLLVVCWALAESIALFGLILGMLGRRELLFFVWAVAVLVALRPRDDYFSAASVSSQAR